MQKWNVIGIMSGTSLDGLDLVYANLSHDKHWSYTIHSAKTFEYDTNWYNKLKKSPNLNANELKQIDIDFGIYIGEKINDFLTLVLWATSNSTDVDFSKVLAEQ